MRRGQLFSADALIALTLVIMIISIVVNTSGDVQGEISNLLGWYEKANVAQNMLDVLTNSPGQPANWSENVTAVRVPGLRSTNGRLIDYQKVKALFEGARLGNPHLLNALQNLSDRNNFKLAFYFVNSSIKANYSVSSISIPSVPSVLNLCNIAQAGYLPNNTPIALYCPNGTFEFTHSGVSYNYYGNPYSVYVLSGAFIGNNFKVYTGENFSVNGSLGVGSDGTLDTTNLYVNGNLSVANTGTLTASRVAYVNGSLYIAGAGDVADVGTIYVYGNAFVGNRGFLNATDSVYVQGNTTVSSYGVVSDRGSLYEYSNLILRNGATATVGGATYIGGNLVESGSAVLSSSNSVYVVGNASLSSAALLSNGSIYVNGPVYIGNGAIINASGDVYINGSAIVYGTLSGRNVYVNGNLLIEGYTGRVVAGNNIVVNGSVTVKGSNTPYTLQSGNSTVVWSNLTVEAGSGVEVGGSLYVGGNLTSSQYANVPINVGSEVIVNQYVNLTTISAPLTVGRNAYVGYQVYSNSSITLENGSMFVYYYNGLYDVYTYYYYGYGVVLGPSSKELDITGGYLYFYDRLTTDRWFALNGTFSSNTDYNMNGYKLRRTRWINKTVRVDHQTTEWYIYLQKRKRSSYYNYTAPIKLISYSSSSVTANIVIDPNGARLVEPNSTLPSFPAYANISQSAWIYSLPPLPPFQLPISHVTSRPPTVTLNVTYVNVSYVYPSLSRLGSSYFQISMVNGSLVNSTVANLSQDRAKWVEQASRITTIRTLVYSRSYNVTYLTPLPKMLYGGEINFPPMGYLEIDVPENQTGNFTLISTYTEESRAGYSILVIVAKNGKVLHGFASSDAGSCNIEVSGNTLLIPWMCMVPYYGVNEKVTFLVWAYGLNGLEYVLVKDDANMKVYMKPAYSYAKVALWVWR